MNSSEKYHSDNAFRQLVDLMESFIHKNQYTPSEMREAAVMASINYEHKRVSPMMFITPELEGALKIIRDFAENEQPEPR